jgi:alpha-N-arabinofuranosidase
MDFFIESVVATADATGARLKNRKRIDLSFDEWNVWYQRGLDGEDQPHRIEKAGWREHPRVIEDEYSVTDAVVVGTLLNSLLRHGDRVKIANQAQLVNVIAPIRSEEAGPAWRQSIFWPFARMAQLATGRILQVEVDSDRYDNDRFGTADVVDVSATWDDEAGTVSLFLANRGLEEDASTEVALRGLDAGRIRRAEVLRVPDGGDRHASNTLESGEQVGLVPLEGVHAEGGRLTLTLPALSWAVVVLDVTRS